MGVYLMGMRLVGVCLTGVHLAYTWRVSHMTDCKTICVHANSPSPELALEIAPPIHPAYVRLTLSRLLQNRVVV
jgi:hypothetical protein